MLCLIILTFKHEKSCWLVLKCIHDLQKTNIQNKQQQKKKQKQKQKQKNKKIERKIYNKKPKIFMKVE